MGLIMETQKNGISEILPKGMSESAIAEITQVVEETINTRVREQLSSVEAKVKSFIRLKIEELKEHALLELQEDNATYRNAKLFEHMKSVVALEIGETDKESTVSNLLEEKSKRNAEYEEISSRLGKALEENEKLTNAIVTMNNDLVILEEHVQSMGDEREELLGEVRRLTESKKKPFLSSEKAVMISENIELKKEKVIVNQFLTPEVMEYMPFTSRK